MEKFSKVEKFSTEHMALIARFPWMVPGPCPSCGAPLDQNLLRSSDFRYYCPTCAANLRRIRVAELGALEIRFLTMAQMKAYADWRVEQRRAPEKPAHLNCSGKP